MASRSELAEVFGPGAHTPDIDWPAVERALGVVLPADYKLMADMYGPVSLDDFLVVLYPGTDNRYVNLEAQARSRLEALRVMAEESRDDASEWVPFVPEIKNGGLLPWGYTTNGDVCYWLIPSADPATWMTVVNESRSPVWHRFDGPMTDFLILIATGRRNEPIFPSDFPSRSPMLVPIRPG